MSLETWINRIIIQSRTYYAATQHGLPRADVHGNGKNMILGPISFFIKQPGKRRSRIWIGLVCGIWLSAFIASPSAGEEKHTSGSSAKSLRKQTVSSLPLDQLNPQTRDKINSVVKKPSVYRRLPVTSISADPDHFRFLVRHPEVVVNIWQLMGVTQMETERTGPYTIKSNDGAGTISSILSLIHI